MTVAEPSYDPGPGAAQPATSLEMGPLDTITESLFGKPDPNSWHPLPLSTLLSEGWDEAWVPSPNGSGGARPARLDQCRRRQHLPAVVSDVRRGV